MPKLCLMRPIIPLPMLLVVVVVAELPSQAWLAVALFQAGLEQCHAVGAPLVLANLTAVPA